MAAARRLVPLLDRVLVEKVVPPTKSAGGILLPESATASKVRLLMPAPLCQLQPCTRSHASAHVVIAPHGLVQVNSAKVVAVGPGGRSKDGNTIPVSVKEGDTVILPEYGGTPLKLDDKE